MNKLSTIVFNYLQNIFTTYLKSWVDEGWYVFTRTTFLKKKKKKKLAERLNVWRSSCYWNSFMPFLQEKQRNVQDYVPDYVINHGVMKAGDLQELLRRSKVLWDQ